MPYSDIGIHISQGGNEFCSLDGLFTWIFGDSLLVIPASCIMYGRSELIDIDGATSSWMLWGDIVMGPSLLKCMCQKNYEVQQT